MLTRNSGELTPEIGTEQTNFRSILRQQELLAGEKSQMQSRLRAATQMERKIKHELKQEKSRIDVLVRNKSFKKDMISLQDLQRSRQEKQLQLKKRLVQILKEERFSRQLELNQERQLQ